MSGFSLPPSNMYVYGWIVVTSLECLSWQKPIQLAVSPHYQLGLNARPDGRQK